MGNKIIHVHFKDSSIEPQDYYFGSVVAIYTRFTPEELGIKQSSLANTLPKKLVYENKNVVIRSSRMIHAQKKNT